MPRTRDQNEAIRDKRRTDILNAAMRLFANRGYDNVSSDDITKAAGCSHGLFYHYYKNKEDVLKDLFEQSKAGCKDTIKSIIESNSRAIDALIALEKSLTSAIMRDQKSAYSIFLAFSVPLSKSFSKSKPDKKFLFFFIDLIERAQKEGDIVPCDANAVGNAFHFFILGLCYSKTRYKNLDLNYLTDNGSLIHLLQTKKD